MKLATAARHGAGQHPLLPQEDPDTGEQTMDVQLTKHQAHEIRRLLRKLGQPVPVDLVKELGIAEPEEYIRHLRRRTCMVVSSS
jgi:hypothetical protein